MTHTKGDETLLKNFRRSKIQRLETALELGRGNRGAETVDCLTSLGFL